MGDLDVTVTMTRGTGSSDKERVQVDVEADDVDELDERMEAVQHRLRQWSEELRAIQPDGRAPVDDSQTELGGATP